MSIVNYAQKLINQGDLKCAPVLKHKHDFFEIWSPDFMESITFIRAKKDNYVSSLHFFWQSIFHLREVKNAIDASEVFNATHLNKVSQSQAVNLIKTCCPSWYESHQILIPESKWIHVIWHDAKDVVILMEDKEFYYQWGWEGANEW